MPTDRLTRREFFARSAVGTAAVLAGAHTLARGNVLGANERICVGVIGTSSRAGELMKDVHKAQTDLNVEITAVCDVWRPNREAAAAVVRDWYGREPRQFTRYQDLIALDEIDAVIIATPDFGHSKIPAEALRAGKDAYVEKPMATELEDARTALDAATETGRVVQVGTQRRSEGRWKAVAKMIRSGILGTISRVEIGWNDAGPRWKRGTAGVKKEDVDWTAYLMGHPDRPFSASQFREWHLYREFCCGPLALLGSHYLDVAAWVMDDPFPSTAVAHGGQYVWKDGREHEDTVYALYDYPKGYMCRYLSGLANSADGGCRIYGTNGTFLESSWAFTGAGGGKDRLREDVKVTPEPSENHVRNWLECIRTRRPTNAPIETGYSHSVACILGYQALRTGRKMRYLPHVRQIVEA